MCIASFSNSDFNPCLPNPCLNDALCERKEYGYYCKCKQGYKGKNCDEGKLF